MPVAPTALQPYSHPPGPFLMLHVASVSDSCMLVAVGFKQNEAGDALVLKDDSDRAALKEAKAKLEAAYAAY
jgi:hypothetical protein